MQCPCHFPTLDLLHPSRVHWPFLLGISGRYSDLLWLGRGAQETPSPNPSDSTGSWYRCIPYQVSTIRRSYRVLGAFCFLQGGWGRSKQTGEDYSLANPKVRRWDQGFSWFSQLFDDIRLYSRFDRSFVHSHWSHQKEYAIHLEGGTPEGFWYNQEALQVGAIPTTVGLWLRGTHLAHHRCVQ